MTAAAAWSFARRILFFAIPVPVALIVAAWVWVTWDKSSAVRRAVDTAVTKLVDGAELDAERATTAALRKIIADRNRQAAADRDALRKFADQLAAADTENGNLADAIALLESQPVNPACTVDQPFLDRLRK